MSSENFRQRSCPPFSDMDLTVHLSRWMAPTNWFLVFFLPRWFFHMFMVFVVLSLLFKFLPVVFGDLLGYRWVGFVTMQLRTLLRWLYIVLTANSPYSCIAIFWSFLFLFLYFIPDRNSTQYFLQGNVSFFPITISIYLYNYFMGVMNLTSSNHTSHTFYSSFSFCFSFSQLFIISCRIFLLLVFIIPTRFFLFSSLYFSSLLLLEKKNYNFFFVKSIFHVGIGSRLFCPAQKMDASISFFFFSSYPVGLQTKNASWEIFQQRYLPFSHNRICFSSNIYKAKRFQYIKKIKSKKKFGKK